MKYWIRKPQMTPVDLQKGEKIGQVTPHAIDKQAEELVFEAACGLDSAILRASAAVDRHSVTLTVDGQPRVTKQITYAMPVTQSIVAYERRLKGRSTTLSMSPG